MSDQLDTILIIPVFNGRDSVLKLIRDIQEHAALPLILVDDGSEDGLESVVPAGLHFLKHAQNRGKGAALQTGLTFAARLGYGSAITLDADGQHDPRFIEVFTTAASAMPGKLLVGRRDLAHAAMPIHRKFSNQVTSLILSLRSGKRVYDSQVGYRCYPLKDSRLWDSIESGFQFESVVFLKAARLKIPLAWITIPVIYGSETSHMHLVRDTLRFIRTIFRSFMC